MPVISRVRYMTIGVFLVLLALIVACGEATAPAAPAAAPQPQPAPDWQALASQAAADAVAKRQTSDDGAVLTPTRSPRATPKPAAIVFAASSAPKGTLNVGMTEIGLNINALHLQSLAKFQFDGLVTHETFFATAPDGLVENRLMKSWTVDSSGLNFEFHLREGAKWHTQYGDWGEYDADDMIFTMEQAAQEGSVHAAAGNTNRIFLCDGCELTKVDSHTVSLKRPTPTFEISWQSRVPSTGSQFALHSKKHFEAVGPDKAISQSVGTGPWEQVQYRDQQYVKVKAVEDHWRVTPEFSEMVWWAIAEESTRVANFQSGLLDTGAFSKDSLRAIKDQRDSDVKYMVFPGNLYFYLAIFGQQYYPEYKTHHPSADGKKARLPLGENAWDCTIPYVSCDRDTSSDGWEKARNVRLAMDYAIDRQALVNNLGAGEGQPIWHNRWSSHPGRQKQYGLDLMKREYDPAKATQLLTDAGYPNGIDVDLWLVAAISPGAPETAKAIAAMWEKVGIRANQVPTLYSAFRPSVVNRTATGFMVRTGGHNIEPITAYRLLLSADGAPNLGIEHPDFQAILQEANTTIDDEKRWALQGEAAKWIFDHNIHPGIWETSDVWPLGPNLDPWAVAGGSTGKLSNWGLAKRRQ
jgi:dipeptide transport system substrate-binding protein